MAKATTTSARKKRFALYWCTTPDGGEDWFVVAESAAVARRFHEDAEGYGRGDAHAERVMALPSELARADGWKDPGDAKVYRHAGWPSDELLVACGGEIAPMKRDQLRMAMGVVCKDVRFGTRVFRAGDVVADIEREHGVRGARLAVFKGGKSNT